jgi:hypothetical protein
MKSVLIFLFLAGITFLISCAERKKNYTELQMISKRIIEIPLDKNTSSNWAFMQYYINSNDEFLVYHDYIKSKEKHIYFANINDDSKSFKVKIFIDGPNGVGSLDGFHIKNLDSIFILNRFSYRIFLMDTSSSVNDSYPLIERSSKENSKVTYLPGILPNTPIIDLGSKLYIPASPDVDPLMEKNYYESYKTGILLDLKTKEFSYHLGYTSAYLNSGFWGMMLEKPSSTINYKDSLILQSFPIEDKIMVYNFDLELVDSPSIFQEFYEGKFHSLTEATLEPDMFYPHIYSNPSNKSILFDPYRNLYYRIFSGPYPENTIKSLRELNFLSWSDSNEYPDRTIMVFDREFNEIGIVHLDKKRYWIDNILVAKEGLMIPIQSEDENNKLFEIFEIKL